MLAVLVLGVALGFDSFRVAVGIGLAHPPRQRQIILVSAFGVCDGTASLVGATLGRTSGTLLVFPTTWVGAAVLVLYGAYLIAVARVPDGREDAPPWVLGLPLALSLDNLVAGVGLGALGVPILPSAAALGLVSGLMTWLGLALGGVAGHRLPQARLIAGATMIMLGLVEGWHPVA